MAKRIICIGDSNTYGYDPAAFGGARYPEGVRWTSRLGSAWDIRNLGENGREIPSSSFAVRVLLGQVRSRLPADGLCLMLGTNDLLCGASPAEAAERMRIFISDLLVCGLPLLLVAPPLMQSGTWVESDELIRRYGETVTAVTIDAPGEGAEPDAYPIIRVISDKDGLQSADV